MWERRYVHGIVIVQNPLAEDDFVSGIVAVAAGVSILSGAGAERGRRIGGKMDQSQREEKDEKQDKNEDVFPVGSHRKRPNCPTIPLEESTGGRRYDVARERLKFFLIAWIQPIPGTRGFGGKIAAAIQTICRTREHLTIPHHLIY